MTIPAAAPAEEVIVWLLTEIIGLALCLGGILSGELSRKHAHHVVHVVHLRVSRVEQTLETQLLLGAAALATSHIQTASFVLSLLTQWGPSKINHVRPLIAKSKLGI